LKRTIKYKMNSKNLSTFAPI